MSARMGDWSQTFTGKQFWPMDPRPEDICIEDVAHHLSNMCRYNGATRYFYSVAEHSALMCQAAPIEFKRWALLHDASEAYLVDVPRPIKGVLSEYAAIEDRLMRAVAERFDLSWPMPPEVKELDNRIILDERNAVMSKPPADWRVTGEPLGVKIHCLEPSQARGFFMSEFRTHG